MPELTRCQLALSAAALTACVAAVTVFTAYDGPRSALSLSWTAVDTADAAMTAPPTPQVGTPSEACAAERECRCPNATLPPVSPVSASVRRLGTYLEPPPPPLLPKDPLPVTVRGATVAVSTPCGWSLHAWLEPDGPWAAGVPGPNCTVLLFFRAALGDAPRTYTSVRAVVSYVDGQALQDPVDPTFSATKRPHVLGETAYYGLPVPLSELPSPGVTVAPPVATGAWAERCRDMPLRLFGDSTMRNTYLAAADAAQKAEGIAKRDTSAHVARGGAIGFKWVSLASDLPQALAVLKAEPPARVIASVAMHDACYGTLDDFFDGVASFFFAVAALPAEARERLVWRLAESPVLYGLRASDLTRKCAFMSAERVYAANAFALRLAQAAGIRCVDAFTVTLSNPHDTVDGSHVCPHEWKAGTVASPTCRRIVDALLL